MTFRPRWERKMIRGVAFIKLVQHVAMVFHYSQNPELFHNRQWRSQFTAKQAKLNLSTVLRLSWFSPYFLCAHATSKWYASFVVEVQHVQSTLGDDSYRWF